MSAALNILFGRFFEKHCIGLNVSVKKFSFCFPEQCEPPLPNFTDFFLKNIEKNFHRRHTSKNWRLSRKQICLSTCDFLANVRWWYCLVFLREFPSLKKIYQFHVKNAGENYWNHYLIYRPKNILGKLFEEFRLHFIKQLVKKFLKYIWWYFLRHSWPEKRVDVYFIQFLNKSFNDSRRNTSKICKTIPDY